MSQKQNTYSAVDEVGAVTEQRTFLKRILIDLRKAPYTARFGILIIFIYITVALFAPILSPYGEAEVFPEPYAEFYPCFRHGSDWSGYFF